MLTVLVASMVLTSATPSSEQNRLTFAPASTNSSNETFRWKGGYDRRHCLIRKSSGKRECRTMQEWRKVADELEEKFSEGPL